MIKIEKPQIEWVEKNEDHTYGKFEVEPLERGYGITLGNSLRRVLLSSLPGAAVTSVKIEGALHEFSTLTGIMEDTTEIILRLKSLCMKVYDEETHTLTVDFSGPGEVYASSINAPAEVEILNTDLLLATLEDEGHLQMEINVVNGRGYVPAERNKHPHQPIGVIPVDSIFTPIRKVNYNVEDTRVGQITDFDKLTMEVWTDGSVKPDEAISKGARILNEHFNLFSDMDGQEAEVELLSEQDEEDKEKIMEMTIEDLDLSVRSYNCLKRAGINTVYELTEKTEDEMMKVRNLGRKSLEEVENKMANLGLTLKDKNEENS